ncbi:unnamed protein product [Adineta steineri]|uniref:MAGE domain-containing protein n=1 Tax=Adineta steineri TaxID=433720 RepID=A0A815DF84_9BILA|nr:unnamed protein product [Adineta steineri]CAF1296432.1 unnamed protein product [Adineta steineri]CAF1378250.1 unnamed protein product [Adineta steineri]CAF1504066.1 unnamed protein product [Adineta steineri]CAF3519801.1 unnamed protein product [Adineta steineri]
MPPKKLSQVATQSQVSTNMSSTDDSDDNDNTFENDANFKQIISASIQYILVHSSKPQIIKRLDWNNSVLRPMGFDGRKHFSSVHKHVVRALNNTFGYKLVADEKHDGYILVNGLKKGPLEHRPLTNSNQYSKYALLMIIIACLKRAGGEMTSTDFWAILGETFSIRNEESSRLTINQHKIFGDVQKLIKVDFVKEGYLILEQAKDLTGDTPTQTVKLGFRAQHEFPDDSLEEFIEKVEQYGIESDEGEDNAMDDDN